MKLKLVILFVFLSLIVSCAANRPKGEAPKREEIVGTYYMGDGLGVNVTLVLSPDGTYSSDWEGCLGNYGKSNGTWRIEGEDITFKPSAESDILKDYFTRATVQHHKDTVALARLQDVKGNKIREFQLFKRQE